MHCMYMESELDVDYELIQDIQGRMILHWNYRNLREIPSEILNYGEHIEEIYLKRNCLEKLPPKIGKLCNLTNLYLVGNQLEDLPEEIGGLGRLRVLDVSQNYIKKLPHTIGQLQLLESLLVTYNQLEELPPCFKNLHQLKQLEMSGNRIHTLPSDIIAGLESLEEFGIDRNPISSIPRNICLLRNLRYFSACRCNLLQLPGLPFHRLMHNHASTSLRAQPTAGTFSCNKNLQFLFDGNPRLNYIPYWVLQLLGTNVECFGCGLEPGESDSTTGSSSLLTHTTQQAQTQLQLYTYHSDANGPKIKLNFKGKRRTLHFDEDLVKLHHCGFSEDAEEGRVKVAVLSLLELCLRQVHSHGLLEETAMKKCGVKPVVEPLIVPQRAGDSLINIRGDLDYKKIVQGDSIQAENALMPNVCSTSRLPSLEMGKTTMKSDDERKHSSSVCSGSHHQQSICGERGKDDHNRGKTKSGSTTGKDTNQSRTDKEAFPHEDPLSLILPMNLSRILMKGPVAKCFECLKPIFTETWPIVFHIPGFNENNMERVRREGGNANDNRIRGDWDDRHADGKLCIGCTHFCSASCVMRFRTGTRFSSNLLMNDLRCILENEIPWIAA